MAMILDALKPNEIWGQGTSFNDYINKWGAQSPITPRLSTPEPLAVPQWQETPDPQLQALLAQYTSPLAQPEPTPRADTAPGKLTPYDVSNPAAPAKYMGEWRARADYNAGADRADAANQKAYGAMEAQRQGQLQTLLNTKSPGGMGLSAYGFRGVTGLTAQRGSAHMGFQPQMWSALQSAFRGMKQAGLGTPGITDGWRSYAAQVDVKRRKGSLAATPGRSIHGLGLAADLNLNRRQQRWLEANGANYGLKRLKSESWHWQLDPRLWDRKWS